MNEKEGVSQYGLPFKAGKMFLSVCPYCIVWTPIRHQRMMSLPLPYW
ncbi:hypothetical protein HMPREF1870_01059 [Bacteroidales bacterium KA00344]|nr:hypothetical protein HMPREF1870_01059 [Bacteroidales bacterium KA00344]